MNEIKKKFVVHLVKIQSFWKEEKRLTSLLNWLQDSIYNLITLHLLESTVHYKDDGQLAIAFE